MSRIFIFLSCIFLLLPVCSAKEVLFKHGDHSLSGHYLEASNGKPAKAVLLFVHGDGAMSYDAEGYYDFIWEPLREKGYAIFSWDKPNVGNSSGSWLEQSMADRQSEVLAAIDTVQKRYHFTAQNTGLIGFSQAGWVLPALSKKTSKVAFVVGVGFATNWVEQGRYLTATRLQLEGKSAQQISSALDAYNNDIKFFRQRPSYKEYVKQSGEGVMDKARYEFVLNNFEADASSDYSQISVPSLFVWGEKDLNVDAKEEFKWWQNHPNKFVTTKLIANASHGMLNASSFSEQNFGYKQWIKLMWLEQDAFAEDFFPTLIDWLEKHSIK